MISAVVLELTRCAEACDDLLEPPEPPDDCAGGDGTLAGDAGAPCDLGGEGGGEGSLELDGAGEDELEVDGDGAADGGRLLLEGGGGAAEEELDDMTARDRSYVFLQRNPGRVVCSVLVAAPPPRRPPAGASRRFHPSGQLTGGGK